MTQETVRHIRPRKMRTIGCAAWLLVMLMATAACGDSLSESEAKQLVDEALVTRGYQQNLPVLKSKLWTSGAIYTLTEIDACWPKQPPAKMPGWNEIACSYRTDCEPLPYAFERGWIRVNSNGVGASCPDVKGALLSQGSNGTWYAEAVTIVTHRPKVGKITEILTRGDTATVSYTVEWEETELYKKWRQDDPELMARYQPPGQNEVNMVLGRSVCLQRYDQGWRRC